MPFGRSPREPEPASPLRAAVVAALPGATDSVVRIVTAVAGLLGAVAYADRTYAPSERDRLVAELRRVNGLDERAVSAIASVIDAHIVTHATVEAPRFARDLVEHADRDLRREVLFLLVDLAAADGTISNDEVTLLRNTTTALGLSQSDYNDAQARHRDKLAALRR